MSKHIPIWILNFFLVKSLFIIFGMKPLISLVHLDSLLTIVISTILGIVFLSLGKDKIEEDTPLKKNVFEALILTVLFIFLLGRCVIYIKETLALNINTSLILVTFLLPILYLGTKKFNIIIKTSEMCFYMYLVFFSFIFIGLCFFIDIENFNNFFSSDIISFIKSVFLYLAITLLPIYLIKSVAKMVLRKDLIFSYIGASFTNLIYTFLTFGILGDFLASTYDYPYVMILQKINFLNIFTRLDFLLSSHYLIDVFLLLSLMAYKINKSIKKEKTIRNV